MVEIAAAGSGGGGAVLTQADKAIIERDRAIALDTALTARKYLHALNRTCLNQWLLPLEGHRAMKLVARNQIAGTIKTVKPGATTKHVTIEVSPTVTITSSVTNEAAEELGLKPGMKAIPVIKASRGDQGVRCDGRRLIGRRHPNGRSLPAGAKQVLAGLAAGIAGIVA